MSTPTIETARPARPWGIAAALCILAAAALWFIQQAARQYSVYDAASYGDLWSRRTGFLPHMAGGLVAISTGLIQLWLGLTHRTGSLHRNLGRVAPDDQIDAMTAWACWSVPLLLVEPLLQFRRTRLGVSR
jgi:hypothetical protein